jgi:hypothetical protein
MIAGGDHNQQAAEMKENVFFETRGCNSSMEGTVDTILV